MTPEDYLQQYTKSLESFKLHSGPAPDGIDSILMLGQGYYYPSYMKKEAYLDTLGRADLLAIVQRILNTEFPQQRLIQRQVDEHLEIFRHLKVEMERLNGELANLGYERKHLETLLIKDHADLENCRGQIAILDNECVILKAIVADLQTSTSWKVTAPLRFISAIVRTFLDHLNQWVSVFKQN